MNKMKLPSPIPTLENVFVKPKSQIYSWKIRYEHKNRRSLFVRLKTVAGYSARVYQISIFTVRILAEKIPGRQSRSLIGKAICFNNEAHYFCGDCCVNYINKLWHSHLCVCRRKPDHRFKSPGSYRQCSSISWVHSLDASRRIPSKEYSTNFRLEWFRIYRSATFETLHCAYRSAIYISAAEVNIGCQGRCFA